MNVACFDPAIHCAHADPRDYCGLLRRYHGHRSGARRAPRASQSMFMARKVNNLFNLDRDFGAFRLQAILQAKPSAKSD